MTARLCRRPISIALRQCAKSACRIRKQEFGELALCPRPSKSHNGSISESGDEENIESARRERALIVHTPDALILCVVNRRKIFEQHGAVANKREARERARIDVDELKGKYVEPYSCCRDIPAVDYVPRLRRLDASDLLGRAFRRFACSCRTRAGKKRRIRREIAGLVGSRS